MLFYSPVTVNLNLLNMVCSLLMICSLKWPESAASMFLMNRDPVFLSSVTLSSNLLQIVVPESALTTRRFSAPNVHSISSALCISLSIFRVTEPPLATDTFITICQNTQKQKHRREKMYISFDYLDNILTQFGIFVYDFILIGFG